MTTKAKEAKRARRAKRKKKRRHDTPMAVDLARSKHFHRFQQHNVDTPPDMGGGGPGLSSYRQG